MKDIYIRIESNDIDEKIGLLVNYILGLNKDKNFKLFSFNGIVFKEHVALIAPFGHLIDRLIKPTILSNSEWNNECRNIANDDNVLISYQYIENINSDYILINIDNLIDINHIDKDYLRFEYHASQYSNLKLLKEYYDKVCKALEEKNIFKL